jgi:hypothetical protein
MRLTMTILALRIFRMVEGVRSKADEWRRCAASIGVLTLFPREQRCSDG